MAVDASISLKTSETFSIGAALRFIYSDLGAGAASNQELEPGYAYAGDIAGYYNNYVMLGNSECLLGLGFNISNIGTKISYNQGNDYNFIPTNLRLGTSLLLPMDDYNTLSLSLDANKYLIPTPPNTEGMSDADKQAARDDYDAISPIAGIFQSFSDAPGGMKEEFQEITWSVGAEYAYNNQFFVRGGYFYEHPNKGNRQYFSLGAGFKMTAFQMDVAYLISTVPSNPLDQTLRFSLTFDMDGLKNLMR
jgi:long-subunit fatty acid transport protein